MARPLVAYGFCLRRLALNAEPLMCAIAAFDWDERGVVLEVRVVSPLGSSSRSLPLVEHDITFGKLELLYGVS
jgi:hypothetical protein